MSNDSSRLVYDLLKSLSTGYHLRPRWARHGGSAHQSFALQAGWITTSLSLTPRGRKALAGYEIRNQPHANHLSYS